jgi:hypothetical protein
MFLNDRMCGALFFNLRKYSMIKNFLIGSIALACFLIGCGSDTSAVFLEPGDNPGSSLIGGAGGETSSTVSSGQGGVQEVVPCDGECQLDNAFAACLNDECVIQECLSGFSDCNGLPGDGCEVNISSNPLSCGSCTNQCFAEGATEVCSGGSCGCQLDSQNKCNCDQGLGDCDSSRENGCESDLNADTSCGACGNVCVGTSQCQDGSCQCSSFDSSTEVNDSCGSCLEQSCCDEMAACQNDSTCMSLYHTWRNCHLQGNNCYWHCDTTNTNLINLRDCWTNAQCGCGFSSNNCP